jgi:hypothetical protein
LLHVADGNPARGEFAADSVKVLDDELDSLDRAGLAKRQALADHHRAGRAGRRHLHHPHARAWRYVMVQVEPDLLDVEVLGGVDVADRDGNDLKFHVHEPTR